MPYSREVRLGIVLYGGVSLAVYENGVAQELYRAIRGEGIYGLIKHLTDSDILVDIISGTSAGGVNGVMLGYALANGRDFGPVADLWRNQADIEALLRGKDDPATDSILDSGYYQSRLAECFESLRATAAQTAPFPSAIPELDLFVTGTDANGAAYTAFDDAGHAIDVKNHRALFKLSYRGERIGDNAKNDFHSASAENLARLCRLTSCFPVAFQPVQIEAADANLLKWGKLRGPAVFLDGGILNNKPFTSTIDEIYRRTANREVERFLIYVEPNPEVFAATGGSPHSPNIVQAGIGALTAIPGYQSIAGDLIEIEAHNERAERLQKILEEIGPADPVPSAAFQGSPLFDPNLDGRPYYACRLIQLRDAAVEGILNDSLGRRYLETVAERRSAEILVGSFEHWAGAAGETFSDFDVYFRMRRAQRVSQALMRHASATAPDPQIAAAWDLINHYFKLFEMLEWAMQSAVSTYNFGWESLYQQYPDLELLAGQPRDAILAQISADKWGRVRQCLLSLLDAAGAVIAPQRDQAGRASFYTLLKDRLSHPHDAFQGNLLRTLDQNLEQDLRAFAAGPVGDLMRGEYARYLTVDRDLFPILFGAGTPAADPIRIVRFSPKDAQRGMSIGNPSVKVCGSVLNAFGGFFKKTWRANDIMIGRMDALCQLTESILTRARLARVARPADFTADSVRAFLPALTPLEAADLAQALNAYLQNPAQKSENDWSNLVNRLVEIAHRDILAAEWKNIVQCALEQEYVWGQYRRNETPPENPYDRSNLHWQRAEHRPDRVLVAVAARAVQEGIAPAFAPGRIAGYSFGDEIPEPILTELVLRTAMRLSTSLIAAAPSEKVRKKLKGNVLHRYVMGIVVPGLYYWTRIRRTRPDLDVVLTTIPPVVALTIWGLTLLLCLGPWEAHVPGRLLAILFGGPFLLLIVWFFMVRRKA